MFNNLSIKTLLKTFTTENLNLNDKKSIIEINSDFFKDNRDTEYLYLIKHKYINENLTKNKASIAIYKNKDKRYLSIHGGKPRYQIIFEIDKDNIIIKDNFTFLYNKKSEQFLFGLKNKVFIKDNEEVFNVLLMPINIKKKSNRLSYLKTNTQETIGVFKDIVFNIRNNITEVQFKNISKNKMFLSMKKDSNNINVKQKNLSKLTAKQSELLIEYKINLNSMNEIIVDYLKVGSDNSILNGKYNLSDFNEILFLTHDKKLFTKKENEIAHHNLVNFLNMNYNNKTILNSLQNIYDLFENKQKTITYKLK